MSLFTSEIKTREDRDPAAKSRLVVNLDYCALLEQAGLVTFADFFHFPGGRLIKRIPDRTVTRITLGQGDSFFLKRHLLELRPPWQRGASEGAVEFHHYCRFRGHGLATAVPVAMGERQVEGGALESFLLTRDFSPLLSLEELIRNAPHLLAGQENMARRRQVLAAAADYARRMHKGGMNHLDFNATHILLPEISGPDLIDPLVAVFDLQRVATNPMAAWRWPVKTLAELNSTLPRELFSDEERLLMLATYLGKETLSASDRLLWRAIGAKTAKIARHTVKRRARRGRERAGREREEQGPRHILIHDRDRGRVEPVTAERLLRKVPGNREVWTGLWRSRPVIIKAFQSPRRGVWQLDREWQGLLALHERGLPAPHPLLRGEDHRGCQLLVMERIGQAQSAAEIPALHTPGPEGSGLRSLLARALANQHRQGVEQRDLHLGNFLLQGERVLSLDPAAMVFRRAPLGRRRSLAQVAELGALLPEIGPDGFRDLALAYAGARQWRLDDRTLELLASKRQEVIAVKLDKRLKKYGRRNTRHEEVVGRHYRLLIDCQSGWDCREPEELAAVLREAYRQHPASAGKPAPFVWERRRLAAYRIPAPPLCGRLAGRLGLRRDKALTLWQDLYRPRPTATPVGLLKPRSSWPALSSFIIVENFR